MIAVAFHLAPGVDVRSFLDGALRWRVGDAFAAPVRLRLLSVDDGVVVSSWKVRALSTVTAHGDVVVCPLPRCNDVVELPSRGVYCVAMMEQSSGTSVSVLRMVSSTPSPVEEAPPPLVTAGPVRALSITRRGGLVARTDLAVHVRGLRGRV